METRPVLVLTLAFAACSQAPTLDPIGDPAVDPHTIEENVQRLTDLEVFTVGSLVVDVPDEAYFCYGPCPGWEDEIAAAEAVAADRLQAFADVSEVAAAGSVVGAYATFDEQAATEDIAALSALQIVEIGAFLKEEPANNPSCYNLPCAEDIAAAEDVNCARAAALHDIVLASEDL